LGTFIYDTVANSVEFDDRTLAHLRIVIMNKLRRSEPFMFDVEMRDGSGRRAFWVSTSVPLQFRFYSTRQPWINRTWIEQLMSAASGPNGLMVLPEPDELVDVTPQPDVSAEPGRVASQQPRHEGSEGLGEPLRIV